MFETNSEKAFAGLIILVAFLLLYLITNMPTPTPTGQGSCTAQCDTHYAYTNEPYIDWTVCGSGCLIEKIEYNQDITHPESFKVTCKCCDCVGSYDADMELPDCEPPLGFIFKMLGRCK